MSASADACIVCGAARWTELPSPGPQSMASDWRVVPEPLAKSACSRCGLVRRAASVAAGSSIYERGYSLYARPPGDPYERARQEAYARWITSTLETVPARVLDVGCGNGSLLLALRDRWPAAELLGCDPSAESVAHGPALGLRLWQGTARDTPGDADLVISVNVIEHTTDPVGFLRQLQDALTAGGRVILICPDSRHPGIELLFADHFFSFTSAHLHALLPRAGLHVEAASTAPEALGEFQMVVARRTDAGSDPPGLPVASGFSRKIEAASQDRRIAYLDRWRLLDARLHPRFDAPAVCFGAGEAAGLLRAYAPRTWSRMRACTVDGASNGFFGDLPLIPLEKVGPREAILVGVRPSDQPRIAHRLRARFSQVVTWYDLVDGEPRA